MKRTVFTLMTFCILSAARASDIATTLHFNPTLSHEANPFVSVWGTHVRGLMWSNFLGILILQYLPLWIYWRYSSRRLCPFPLNIREFASLQLFRRILSKQEFLRASFLGVPMPKDLLQAVRLWGVAGSWTLAAGSCLAVFNWWAVWGWHWSEYGKFRATVSVGGYPMLELLCMVPIYYVAAWVYFRSEFYAARKFKETEGQSFRERQVMKMDRIEN